MNPTQVKVSIIIPHHGGDEILDDCISSLQKSHYKNYETIVVDNNCQDSSINKIKNKFPEVKIISLKQNLGYAGGCNAGALESIGDYLLFLNNDTIHEPNWLQPLVDLMDSDHTIGSIQPKINNIHNNHMFDYAGGAGGFLDIFCFPFIRGRVFNHIEKDEGQYNNQIDVFWASGCSFITRKDLFKSILFDTKLFAYMEEIDYSWKINLSGYRNVVEPKSTIYHDGGTLLERNFLKSYYNHRNSLILFLTNHNPIIMISLLAPKLFLELLSLLRYIIIFNFNGLIAQICSLLWILTHPLYLIGRINKINRMKKKPLYSIIHKMYKTSIVFKYYIFRKKKYSELVD